MIYSLLRIFKSFRDKEERKKRNCFWNFPAFKEATKYAKELVKKYVVCYNTKKCTLTELLERYFNLIELQISEKDIVSAKKTFKSLKLFKLNSDNLDDITNAIIAEG